MCVVSGGWSGSVSGVHYFNHCKSCMCLVQVLCWLLYCLIVFSRVVGCAGGLWVLGLCGMYVGCGVGVIGLSTAVSVCVMWAQCPSFIGVSWK